MVRTGAERAVADPALLGPGRLGLFTNCTGTLTDLSRTVDRLLAAGAPITTLFGPEHGIDGSAQAGAETASGRDLATGLDVRETYRLTADELDRAIGDAPIDTIVFDIQDLGLRFYTYAWSMSDALHSAARIGKRFVLLDRPDPLGGAIAAGPGLEAAFASFVGRRDVPIRYGLTLGELARLIVAEDGLDVDLDVVTVTGWRRDDLWPATGLVFVPPSLNIPTFEAATCYAGTCLIEGTNLSEGRGTALPFQLVGAPYADHRLARRLRDARLPGLAVREAHFVPTFSTWSGQTCHGVGLHPTDPVAFDALDATVTLLGLCTELYPEFEFLPPSRDLNNNPGTIHPIDRLWGSTQLRTAILAGHRPSVPPASTPSALYPDSVLCYD